MSPSSLTTDLLDAVTTKNVITIEEAIELIQLNVKRNPVAKVDLLSALGCALAEDIRAKFPSPLFDASAVDGYAVKLSDFRPDGSATLTEIGEVKAGITKPNSLRKGTTIRIFTGAEVPNGTDAIVMQEDVTVHANKITFTKPPKPGSNIRKRGGEFARGTLLFAKGSLITPAVISTLATLGLPRVAVYKKPSVAIVVTGDELRQPGEKLLRGEIYDANSYALRAALMSLGIAEVRVLHARDTLGSTKSALTKALEFGDLVIATGGVSVGDHDHVREVLTTLGVREHFWRVKIKPGKPTYFGSARASGSKRAKYVLGLPGNPVAVMVGFQVFVRRILALMLGYAFQPDTIRATLTEPITKPKGRAELVRGKLERKAEGTYNVRPLHGRDSHMTTSMALADCLIYVGEEDERKDGEVEVTRISWD